MEADLSRFHGIDYRDRWRFDDAGRRRLTLRQIIVRLRFLPLDSAVATCASGGRMPWSRTEQLLDELRRRLDALGGVKDPKPHPDRGADVRKTKASPARRKQLAMARERAKERRRRIEAGEIT